MKFNELLKNNSSSILTGIGVVGVIGTAVLSACATPKVVRLVENTEYEKGEKLTKLEKVRIAAPAYIPAVLTGAATIACIIGANILNKQQQASLISAYALLDRSYKDYRHKVIELYGEEADTRIRKEIAQEDFEKELFDMEDDEFLFYDECHRQYFVSGAEKAILDDGLECYIISVPLPYV